MINKFEDYFMDEEDESYFVPEECMNSPMDEEGFIKCYEDGRIWNLRTYFDEELNYIEEFDTADGCHNILIAKYEDWNEKIRQCAYELLVDD